MNSVARSNSPNPLEWQIIVLLCEIELFGRSVEKYRDISSLPDNEFVKKVFESYLGENWECNLSNLHNKIDTLAGLPCELIPDDLFKSAMQVALQHIDWNIVAQDEKVLEKIQFLRS